MSTNFILLSPNARFPHFAIHCKKQEANHRQNLSQMTIGIANISYPVTQP